MDVLIDNKKGKDFSVSIAERPSIPTPEQRIEKIEIDGRDGSLTKKKGYNDISFPVDFNLLEEENVKGLLRRIKAWLINAETLQFTDDTVYYKVKNVTLDKIENEVEFYGYFTANFECDPFQYEIDEIITLAKESAIENIGTYFSRPLIRVYGSGNCEVYVNGETIALKFPSVANYIDVDSELGNAFIGSTNMNKYMTGDFPIFQVGANTISFSNNVTKIEIEPRWRYI